MATPQTNEALRLLIAERDRLDRAIALLQGEAQVPCRGRPRGNAIRQNLFWASIYNTAGVGVAVAGLLNPAVGAGAMALSSLSVIANSMRARESPPPKPLLTPRPLAYCCARDSDSWSPRSSEYSRKARRASSARPVRR